MFVSRRRLSKFPTQTGHMAECRCSPRRGWCACQANSPSPPSQDVLASGYGPAFWQQQPTPSYLLQGLLGLSRKCSPPQAKVGDRALASSLRTPSHPHRKASLPQKAKDYCTGELASMQKLNHPPLPLCPLPMLKSLRKISYQHKSTWHFCCRSRKSWILPNIVQKI